MGHQVLKTGVMLDNFQSSGKMPEGSNLLNSFV